MTALPHCFIDCRYGGTETETETISNIFHRRIMARKEIKYNSFIFSFFFWPDTFAEYIDLDIIFEYQRLLLEMHSESDVT